MHPSKSLGSLIATSLVVLAACGGSDGDGLSGDGHVTLTELPALYARAYCDAQRACAGDVLEVFLAGEDCEANVETAIADEIPRIEQAIAAGKMRYDGTKVQACVDELRSRGCLVGTDDPVECTNASDGTVAEGDACSMSAECAGGNTYCKTDATCPGRCAVREAAGGPCRRNSECAAGLQCSEATRRCYAPAAAGAACDAGAPKCRDDLVCVGADEDSGQSGQCRSFADAFSLDTGAACLIDAPFCKADLRCVIESGAPLTTRCAAPVASGAPCKLALPDVCPGDQYCRAATDTVDGVCTAKPGNGQPCAAPGIGDDPICAPGTRCDGGTCRTRQRLGGTCAADAVCYSENCIAGGCAPAGACE
jgi:hypothetical protein